MKSLSTTRPSLKVTSSSSRLTTCGSESRRSTCSLRGELYREPRSERCPTEGQRPPSLPPGDADGSSVLRDAKSLGVNNTYIPLTDPLYETADIVRAFLTLSTTWRLDFATTRPLLPRLLPFLRKYDARQAFELVMGAIHAHLGELGRSGAFLLGSHAADIDMCLAALGEDAHEVLQLLWSFERDEFEQLPPDYRWALWRTAGATHCVEDGTELGKVFQTSLAKAQRGE